MNRAANASNEECLGTPATNVMCIQFSLPAQPPQVDVGKNRSSRSLASLMKN